MPNRERNEAILRRLVAAPSVSRDEEAGVEVCLELMREVGLDARLVPCARDPGAVNVEGWYGPRGPGGAGGAGGVGAHGGVDVHGGVGAHGGAGVHGGAGQADTSAGPTLCLVGHIDTVPFDDMVVNPLGELRGTRYYGRGTCDMKGGLAAILAAVEQVIAEGPALEGRIVVVGTASEETLKSGGLQLARDHGSVDGVVCAEPTSNRVAVAATGSLPLRVDVHGAPGHSSQPGSGVNAVRAALAVVDAIYQAFDDEVEVPHVGVRRRGVNAGVIRGGLAQPVVAASCSVWMDIRIFPGETKEALLERLALVLRSCEARTPGMRAEAHPERLDYQGEPYPVGSLGHEVHVTRGMRPFSTDPEARVVRAFREALLAEGGTAELTMMAGWGDIEFLATDHGVPAIYFGPGDVVNAHADDEFIELEAYHRSVAVYARAIRNFFSVPAADA